MEDEKKMFDDGLHVIKNNIHNMSDMDYYFRIYGKIENYLFPFIRNCLLKVAPNFTDSQQEFLDEFAKLINKTGFTHYATYFDGIPPNDWLTDIQKR